jgi:hypothetical protein
VYINFIKLRADMDDYSILKTSENIWANVLIKKLASEGIHAGTAMDCGIEQAYLVNSKTGKKENALLYPNNEDGQELVLPNGRSTIGKAGISSIIGDGASDRVLIFKDLFGFLRWHQRHPLRLDNPDFIILNEREPAEAVAYLQEVRPTIKKARFLDSDKPIELALASEFDKTDIEFGVMEGWNDVKPLQPVKYSNDTAWDNIRRGPVP